MDMQISTDTETILPQEAADLKLPPATDSSARKPKPEKVFASVQTASVKLRPAGSRKHKPTKTSAKAGSAGAKRKRNLMPQSAAQATPGAVEKQSPMAGTGRAGKLPDLSAVFNPSELDELRLKSKPGLVASSWKWLAERLKTQQAKKRLRVCETVALGEKRFIAVVQVDDQQFLVGGSSSSVSTLAHLERPRGFAAVFQKGLAQSVNRT
jgi:hypothetical protein